MPAVTVLVTYRPKPGKERAFRAILRRHWPALAAAGLVTRKRARVWRAEDKRTRRVAFVELFTWRDAKASEAAHRTPEVMALWGPMEPLLESMEIARVEELPQT